MKSLADKREPFDCRAIERDFAVLSATPERRREQIELQVALANALMHTRGHASLDAKAAVEEARALITAAEAPASDFRVLPAASVGISSESPTPHVDSA